MKVKCVDFSEYKSKFVSLSGKLWVSNTPYYNEIDSILMDDEEAYFEKYELVRYVKKNGDRRFAIDRPLLWKIMDYESEFSVLRYIADYFFECFLNAREIAIRDDWRKSIHIDGEKIVPGKLLFPYEERKPRFVVLKDGCRNEYYEQYKNIILPKSISRIPEFIVLGRYFIEIQGYTVDIYDVTDTTKRTFLAPNRPIFLRAPEIEVFEYDKNITIVYDDKNKVKLYSPKDVPSNAFLISGKPKFLQFTKSGIVETNGIFFAKEQLEEVRKPWYIVEKTENGWDIYLSQPAKYSGYYKIIHNSLVKVTGCENIDNHNEINKDLIYSGVVTKVYFKGDNIVIDGKEFPKDLFFKRYKLETEDGVIYVPKILLKNIISFF